MFNCCQFYKLFAVNKANQIPMVCNGRIHIFAPMSTHQQFRSFWHSRPLQKASDNDSYINLDHLWTAKPATTMTSSPMETSDFPRILVPEDVFTFVRAMDELVNAVNRNRDRIEAKSNNTDQQVFVLHTAMAKGTTYDFELDLCLGQSLFVNMRSVPNERKPGHKPRFLRVPYRIFHWLRRAIGEVFVESGERTVQQQLGEPPRLPVWLNKDVFLM